MQNESPVRAEHAPINWVTTIVFTATPLAALVLVPWYGITHGYSLVAWLSLVVFLWACGISITAGYHRLWSHRAYQAHWSVRLFFMLFGAMALQNSILIWGSQHRTHHRFVDDVDRDLTVPGAVSGFRTWAGSCATTRVAGTISPTRRTSSAIPS
jgi:stearoyl-CoA desaturase (delta-9 desaturase)